MDTEQINKAERMRGALWGIFVGDAGDASALVLQHRRPVARLWSAKRLPSP